MVRIRGLTYTIPFLRLSCTESHHYGTILRKVLSFFLYVQKNQPTCRPDMTCHVVWHGPDDRIYDLSGRHSRHFPDMSACHRTTCHLGGSRDTTRRRHFQLRSSLTTLAVLTWSSATTFGVVTCSSMTTFGVVTWSSLTTLAVVKWSSVTTLVVVRCRNLRHFDDSLFVSWSQVVTFVLRVVTMS